MSSNGKNLLSRDRLGILQEVFRKGQGRIGIFSTRQFLSKAKQVRDRLKELVAREDVTVIQLRNLQWLAEAESASITHLIFIQPEDVGDATQEREIASKYALNNASKILVIASFMPVGGTSEGSAAAAPKRQHYLSGFVHLSYHHDAKWLAQAAITIFAGEQCVCRVMCVCIGMHRLVLGSNYPCCCT